MTTTKTAKMHVQRQHENSYLWWTDGIIGCSNALELTKLMRTWEYNGGEVVIEQHSPLNPATC